MRQASMHRSSVAGLASLALLHRCSTATRFLARACIVALFGKTLADIVVVAERLRMLSFGAALLALVLFLGVLLMLSLLSIMIGAIVCRTVRRNGTGQHGRRGPET